MLLIGVKVGITVLSTFAGNEEAGGLIFGGAVITGGGPKTFVYTGLAGCRVDLIDSAKGFEGVIC